MAEKTLTEQFESIFLPAQQDIGMRAQSQAGYLFRWTVGRLLLGEDIAEAYDWLAGQLDGFQPGASIKKDMNKWLHLCACAAVLGVPPTEQAQRACDYLRSAQVSDADDAIIQAGLALSILGDRKPAASDWLARQYDLPPRPDAAVFAFELLVMATASIDGRGFGVALPCDVATRVFVDSLWAPPPYSAAPHFCILAKACADGGDQLSGLIDQRLADMDARAFASDHSANIVASPVRLDRGREPDGNMAMRLSIKVSGRGELDPGLSGLQPLFARLPETLTKALAGASRGGVGAQLRRGDETEIGASRGTESFAAPTRIVLEVEPEVAVPGATRRFIEHRFDVAWHYACRQLPGIGDSALFEILYPAGRGIHPVAGV